MNQPLKNASYTRTYGAPTTDTWPRFFMDTVLDPLATERAGREIWKDVERIELNFPGNPYNKPVSAVNDEHRERWPREYEAFKKGQDMAVSGTPIDILPFLKPSMVRELKALDIMTVEQLAALSDHGIQRIAMGGRRLKELAAAYLDDATAIALVTQAQAENDRKDAEIASLKLQIENMNTQVQAMWAREQEKLNAPHPLLATPPMAHDPMELLRQQQAAQPSQQSSFENLPAPPPRRRRGAQAEAGGEA